MQLGRTVAASDLSDNDSVVVATGVLPRSVRNARSKEKDTGRVKVVSYVV